MANLAISVKGIKKTYTTYKKQAGIKGAIKSFFHRETIAVHAVKETNFDIKVGEFVGLLGPNGAGKTTILKMLSGLIPPTEGTCTAFETFSTPQRPKDYLRKIGMVMGQRNQLHPDLPAIDSFKLSQAIYDIPETKFNQRLEECLSLFEIHSKLNIPVRKLSLGERMKMELILAILHEPELLFLDEPTIGLDFHAAQQIRSFLKQANQKFGITIILTSHYTKDIEELCRRVILINHGTIVYDGSLEGLDDRIQGERQFNLTLANQESVNALQTWVQSNNQLNLTTVENDSVTQDKHQISFTAPWKLVTEVTKELCEKFSKRGLIDLTITERSLEDVFAEVYRRSTPTQSST